MSGSGGILFNAAISILLVTAMAAADAREDGQEPVFGASLRIGSDYVFRGVSQTVGAPAVQVGVDAEFASGLYAYIWGSNVDFVPDGEPGDGASLEVNAAIGLARTLTDRWSFDAMIVRYVFPGTREGIDYDYDELLGTLWLDERYSVTVGWSDTVCGSCGQGVYYAIGVHHELPAELSLQVVAGHYDLADAFGASYSYSDLRLSRPLGASTFLQLAYYDTYGDANQLFYEQTTGERLVLALTMEF